MPYGVSSGSEMYQQAIESLMEGTTCKVIVDDILIYGTNMAGHDANLKIVLKRLHKINLRLGVPNFMTTLWQTVTVKTDHKPLESIFKKPISKAPARLQNMLLKLQKYSLIIVFKKGSKMYFADTLSRAYLKEWPIKTRKNSIRSHEGWHFHLSSKDWRTSNSHYCRWNSLKPVANNHTRKLAYKISKCPFLVTTLLPISRCISSWWRSSNA